MWSVPDVKIGTTAYSDDPAGAWWQSEIDVGTNTSGACSNFFTHLSDFGWTTEQGKEFQLPIDMRTLVLATAVNDGFVSLDPEVVSQSMLPLSKKFYSGPDLEDDLITFEDDGGASFDDIPMFDDDFFMIDDAYGGGYIFGPMDDMSYGGGYYDFGGYYDYGGW